MGRLSRERDSLLLIFCSFFSISILHSCVALERTHAFTHISSIFLSFALWVMLPRGAGCDGRFAGLKFIFSRDCWLLPYILWEINLRTSALFPSSLFHRIWLDTREATATYTSALKRPKTRPSFVPVSTVMCRHHHSATTVTLIEQSAHTKDTVYIPMCNAWELLAYKCDLLALLWHGMNENVCLFKGWFLRLRQKWFYDLF